MEKNTQSTRIPCTADNALLELALKEDLGWPWRDVTSDLLFANSEANYQAKIISKHPETIIICGLDFTRHLFAKFDCTTHSNYADGEALAPGEILLTIEGRAKNLLRAERLALNFLRHLSAIASLTAKYVDKVKHTSLKIMDTRKTTPGFRRLEKYAVHCGGGVNHRMGLYESIIVKDTHIDIMGGMEHTLMRLNVVNPCDMPVIVEVRTPQELKILLSSGARVSRVLFDNMPVSLMRECVLSSKRYMEIEASGNINLDNIVAVAETGVNYASVGRLTYDAGHVDLSMQTG